MNTKWVFLGHEELASVRQLRRLGKLDEAEIVLLGGEPSQAVLGELRKIHSERARLARKAKDWRSVIKHLEAYNSYANQWAWYCRKMVNADPPHHTEQDRKLLDEARSKVSEQEKY